MPAKGSRTVRYLLSDGEIFLVRELVDGAAVPRDFDGLQHTFGDTATVSRLSHERRDCLDVCPSLFPGYLRQVRGAVLVAVRVTEVDNDPVRTDLPVVVTFGVLVVDEQRHGAVQAMQLLRSDGVEAVITQRAFEGEVAKIAKPRGC